MVSFVEDEPAALRRPVVLSIQTDKAGHSILRSSDGCMGGTFLNRHARCERSRTGFVCLMR